MTPKNEIAPTGTLRVGVGSCIVAGGFQQTTVSIAVPLARAAALEYVKRFLEKAKSDGSLRHIFDSRGLKEEAVAPVGL
jgi:polar amino acid transport system substrate-binding protein